MASETRELMWLYPSEAEKFGVEKSCKHCKINLRVAKKLGAMVIYDPNSRDVLGVAADSSMFKEKLKKVM